MENTKAKVMSTNEIGPNNFVDIFILEALNNNDKFINNWFLQSEETISSKDKTGSHKIKDYDIRSNEEIVSLPKEADDRKVLSKISGIIIIGLLVIGKIKLVKS